jgi:hypothetical protein
MRACFMLARVRTIEIGLISMVRTPSSPVREREVRKSESERERCRICSELLFLFLKGMTGALAPFSYLV